jgi:hypothetical protein
VPIIFQKGKIMLKKILTQARWDARRSKRRLVLLNRCNNIIHVFGLCGEDTTFDAGFYFSSGGFSSYHKMDYYSQPVFLIVNRMCN